MKRTPRGNPNPAARGESGVGGVQQQCLQQGGQLLLLFPPFLPSSERLSPSSFPWFSERERCGISIVVPRSSGKSFPPSLQKPKRPRGSLDLKCSRVVVYAMHRFVCLFSLICVSVCVYAIYLFCQTWLGLEFFFCGFVIKQVLFRLSFFVSVIVLQAFKS